LPSISSLTAATFERNWSNRSSSAALKSSAAEVVVVVVIDPDFLGEPERVDFEGEVRAVRFVGDVGCGWLGGR